MSAFCALPPGIINQLQKGTADDTAKPTVDDSWKQLGADKYDRDNVRLLKNSDTDGVSLQLTKPNSKQSEWL